MSGGTAALPAGSGTPKMGIDCRTCDDWGTVVVEEPGLPGREETCPANCGAAGRIPTRRCEPPLVTAGRTPDYWLRRRAGGEVAEVAAAQAEEIAQRPGVVGDLYGDGLVWQEPDPRAYSGLTFVTLTPVWEQR